MSTRKHLQDLEDECMTDKYKSMPIIPPNYSILYWKDDVKNHKVFIPTPSRQVFYDLEEFNVSGIQYFKSQDRWKRANRCVCLAVYEESVEDKPVIVEMNNLMENIIKLNTLKNSEPKQKLKLKFSTVPGDICKYYILVKYHVKDIEHIPLEEWFKHAVFFERLSLSVTDDQSIINSINSVFRACRKRFAMDHHFSP